MCCLSNYLYVITFQSLTASALLLLPLVSGLPLPEAQLVPAVHDLHRPALVQHADGRLFAVNAHLQPGQLFQAGDGRVFTLANTDNQYGPPPPPPPAASTDLSDNEAVIEVRKTDDMTEDTRLQPIPAVPALPQPQPQPRPQPRAQPQPQPSTSQVQSLPFQVVESGVRTAPAGPAVPLLRGLPSTVPFSPAAAGLPSVPSTVPFTPAAASVPSVPAVLPQSNSAVVTGYFSFPTAGFDFNF